ncbi:hypothetical protein HK414_24715 [Ramlibacter terrae]|uniref:Uncharacterized protein n=1 Tax=Ramlibacter terrae TaxID=2732511 RepID=A0ABX6P5L2_9BURK|nr:hypothetical protein HK414_24715 [Ramlibacter terrae]
MKKNKRAILSPEEAARRRFLQLFGAAVPRAWRPGWPAAAAATTAPHRRKPRGRPDGGAHLLLQSGTLAPTGGVRGDGGRCAAPAGGGHARTPAQARRNNVQVPDDAITHVAERIPMLSDGPQMCMVRGYDPAQPGQWHLQGLFTHIPRAVRASGLRKGACGGKDADALRARFVAACGGSLQAAAVATAGAANFCSTAGDFKDTFDTAVSLIHSHPEIMSPDAATPTTSTRTSSAPTQPRSSWRCPSSKRATTG